MDATIEDHIKKTKMWYPERKYISCLSPLLDSDNKYGYEKAVGYNNRKETEGRKEGR